MAKRARRPRVARMGSGGSLLPSGDGLGQLALGHGRAAPDPELAGPAEQLVLAVAVDVQAPVRLPAGLAVAARRARVGRALVVLGLPVVADLLERVLQRRERGLVRSAALPVRLHRAVVGLRPRALRLRRRAPDGIWHLVPAGHRTDSS